MPAPIEIVPAILPKTFLELQDNISLVKDFFQTIQIDVCDGQFVPNSTWPYRKADQSFDSLIREEIGLPAWDKLDFEIDLMANKPEQKVEDWIKAGAKRIIIHFESLGSIAQAIEKLSDQVEVGLALNVETPIEVVEKYRDRIAVIQCMGIDQIGFQGQDFNPQVLEKIKAIKIKYPDLMIAIDGGVSLANVQTIVEAGANRLVVGSALFEADNIVEAITKFKQLIE